MMHDQDVETALRTWLDEQTGYRPPSRLAESILRETVSLGQQPSWLPPIGVGSQRPPVPRALALVVVIALLAALTAGALAALSQLLPHEPDGRIIYADADAGWVMAADGSGLHRLTDQPVLGIVDASPDGTRITFISGTAVGGVFVANADGTDARRITEPDLGVAMANPSWSPDGARILFTRWERAGGWIPHVFVIGADGANLVQLTRGEDADFEPAWSPDGSLIVFVRQQRLGGQRFISDLYTMRPDGSEVRRLIDDPGSEFMPAWSPDGSRVAFTYLPTALASDDVATTFMSGGLDGTEFPVGPVELFDIVVMNADGSGRQQLTSAPAPVAWAPAWSPDGRYLAFSGYWPARLGTEEPFAIFIIGADGTGLRHLSHGYGPAWVR